MDVVGSEHEGMDEGAVSRWIDWLGLDWMDHRMDGDKTTERRKGRKRDWDRRALTFGRLWAFDLRISRPTSIPEPKALTPKDTFLPITAPLNHQIPRGALGGRCGAAPWLTPNQLTHGQQVGRHAGQADGPAARASGASAVSDGLVGARRGYDGMGGVGRNTVHVVCLGLTVGACIHPVDRGSCSGGMWASPAAERTWEPRGPRRPPSVPVLLARRGSDGGLRRLRGTRRRCCRSACAT